MNGYRALLEAARRDTGLQDFGEDSFREGLEILNKALSVEAQLNELGERILRERIIGHLKQRLQIEDWYRRHPEIDEQVLNAPLIGLSLPRTGSTVLSFLLAQDTASRGLYRAEAAEPCPPPTARNKSHQGENADLAMMRESGLRPHVPAGETATAECQDLMALDFKSHIFQAFAQIPSYSQWLLDADLRSTYHYERRVLKLLQWRQPAKPWRLKCPTHLLFIDHLNEAFPDARFVMTHREPAEVMLSVVDVYADIVGRFTDQLDVAYLAELNIQHWSVGMNRTLKFRDAGHDKRFFDIDFRAMHKDPIARVRDLYNWLGEPVSEQFDLGMQEWWRQNSAQRESDNNRAAMDYGVDLAQVRPLFSDYSARFVKA